MVDCSRSSVPLDIRLKILDLGDMTLCKRGLIHTLDPTEMIVSPAFAVLIRHPIAGYILYDTGNDPDWETTYSDAKKKSCPVTRTISIVEALEKEGLTPRDINILALSHMHFDHVGGLRQFSGTEAGNNVIVSTREMEYAVAESKRSTSAYLSNLFLGLANISYHLVEGCYELAPGVVLFPQNSHTKGLMGLKVTLPHSGTILFTSDAVFTAASDRENLPPYGYDSSMVDAFHQNLVMLRRMKEKYNATLFYGHDIEQVQQWQQKGWIG